MGAEHDLNKRIFAHVSSIHPCMIHSTMCRGEGRVTDVDFRDTYHPFALQLIVVLSVSIVRPWTRCDSCRLWWPLTPRCPTLSSFTLKREQSTRQRSVSGLSPSHHSERKFLPRLHRVHASMHLIPTDIASLFDERGCLRDRPFDGITRAVSSMTLIQAKLNESEQEPFLVSTLNAQSLTTFPPSTPSLPRSTDLLA